MMLVLMLGLVIALCSCATTGLGTDLARGKEVVFPKKDLLGRTVGVIVVVRDNNDQLQVYDSDWGPGGNYIFTQDPATGEITDKGSYPGYSGYGYGAQGNLEGRRTSRHGGISNYSSGLRSHKTQ